MVALLRCYLHNFCQHQHHPQILALPELPHSQETLPQTVIAGSRGLRRLVLFMGKEETMNGDKMKISLEKSLSHPDCKDRRGETWNRGIKFMNVEFKEMDEKQKSKNK